MTELDYELEIIAAMKSIHMHALNNKENRTFWNAVEKLGNQAQEILEFDKKEMR